MKPFCISISLFLFTLTGQAQPAPSADAVLTEAYAQAAKENKSVMVIFHASWCGWCRKMDTSLNDPSVKDYFDRNYVITHLVVSEFGNKKQLENAGAEELKNSWGGKGSGIPFWVVLDAKGKILANSQNDEKKNIGCPATAEEVTHFIKVLKTTSSINAEQIAAVEKRFRRNE